MSIDGRLEGSDEWAYYCGHRGALINKNPEFIPPSTAEPKNADN